MEYTDYFAHDHLAITYILYIVTVSYFNRNTYIQIVISSEHESRQSMLSYPLIHLRSHFVRSFAINESNVLAYPVPNLSMHFLYLPNTSTELPA